MTMRKKLEWAGIATGELKGKTVEKVRYMSDDEMSRWGWTYAAAIIVFTDGSWMLPMCDDEGNAPGAIAVSTEMQTIPVI